MPNFKENKSAFMMKGKSPMMKALVGKQGNLPVDLQKEILAAPTKMYGKAAPIKNKDKKTKHKDSFKNRVAGQTNNEALQKTIKNWHMFPRGSWERNLYQGLHLENIKREKELLNKQQND